MNKLFLAIRNEDTETVEKLIAQDISLVHYTDEYLRTPLHMASYVGNIDMVHFLLDSGADINATDESNDNPLMLCHRNKQFKNYVIIDFQGCKC